MHEKQFARIFELETSSTLRQALRSPANKCNNSFDETKHKSLEFNRNSNIYYEVITFQDLNET